MVNGWLSAANHRSGPFRRIVIPIASRGREQMTSDAFRTEFNANAFDGLFAVGKLKLASIATFIGYASVFIGYLTIFVISLLTVGFLEIRQANMTDFNALIAVLEQRDRYADDHLQKALATLNAERDGYRARIDSLVCFDIDDTTVLTGNTHTAELANSEATSTNPKTCAEIKSALQRHANELSLAEDETRFKSANLALYYDQYKDGITRFTSFISACSTRRTPRATTSGLIVSARSWMWSTGSNIS